MCRRVRPKSMGEDVRLIYYVVRETEEREKVGQQMEGARRIEENDGTRLAEARKSARRVEKSEGTGEDNKEDRVDKRGEKGRNSVWQQEMKRRRDRAKNVVFRNVNMKKDRVDKERVEKWLEVALRRKAEVEDLWAEKDDMLIVRMKRIEDATEVLQRKDEIWERLTMCADKDRIFKERRCRWMVSEWARKERRKGKKVIEQEGRVWVDGTWWTWKEDAEEWTGEIENRDTEETASRRKELDRWRKDLEERMRELEKEERELEAAERELIETEEAMTSNKERVEADTGARMTQEESCEVQPNSRKVENGQGSSGSLHSATQESSRLRSNQGKEGTGEKEKKKKPIGKVPEDRSRHSGGTDSREKRREKVKNWRADLEQRKEKLRKELEELEAEEAKELLTDKTESARGGVPSCQAGE